MNIFLKILLLIVVAAVAIKLLPFTLALVCLLAATWVVAGFFGLTFLAVLGCAALAVIAVLSPIWIPVLAIAGVVALCRRGRVAR